MKSIRLLFIASLLTTIVLALQSQDKVMQIYSGGNVVYAANTSQVDSITFGYEIVKGEVIGYMKCHELVDGKRSGNTLFSFFIITEAKDSLMTFNIEPSFFDIDDEESLPYSAWYIYTAGLTYYPEILFTYRNAKEDEIEPFELYPHNGDIKPSFPLRNFHQQVIISIR